jgi:rhodanese-related sulfurtransferase
MKEAIKENITIIDIRRADEWKKTGIIKGSHTLTFFDNTGKYDINKWMSKFTKIVKNKKQPFVLVCAHANRTKMVGEFLSQQKGYKHSHDLKGGISNGWLQFGLDTIPYNKKDTKKD